MKLTKFIEELSAQLTDEKNLLRTPNSLSYSDQFRNFIYFEINTNASMKLVFHSRLIKKLWLIMDPDACQYGSLIIFFKDRNIEFHALNTSSIPVFKSLFLEAKVTQYNYYVEYKKPEKFRARENATDPHLLYFDWKNYLYNLYYKDTIKEFYPALHRIILGLINNLIESLNLQPKSITILDMGCADCQFLRLMNENQGEISFNLIGFDISQINIEEAKSLTAGSKVKYFVLDLTSTDLVKFLEEEKLLDGNPVIVTAIGLMTHRVLSSLESAFILQNLYRLPNCLAIYLAGLESRSFSDFLLKQIGFTATSSQVVIDKILENPVSILTQVEEKKLIQKKLTYLQHYHELDLSLSPCPDYFLSADSVIESLLKLPSPLTIDISYCRLSPTLKQAMINLSEKIPIYWRYHHMLVSELDEFISFFINHAAISDVEARLIQSAANMIDHRRILDKLHDTGQEQIQELFNFLRYFDKHPIDISKDSRLVKYFKDQFNQLSKKLMRHSNFSYNIIQLSEDTENWQKFFAFFDPYIKTPFFLKFAIGKEKLRVIKPQFAIDMINSNDIEEDLGPSGLGHTGGHWVRFEQKDYYFKPDPQPFSRKLSTETFTAYTQSTMDINQPRPEGEGKCYNISKPEEPLAGNACLEFLSYQLLDLYRPGSIPKVKLGFDPNTSCYSIFSEKIATAALQDAEQEYRHLLDLLDITFISAYILGNSDITEENFAWGNKLVQIDPEIGSFNFPFTSKAIDPAWLLSHVFVRIKGRLRETSKFHVSLLKFYDRSIGDFLDHLILLQENILNKYLKAHRTLVVSSMQAQIGEKNVNFILDFLNEREIQFLEFLQNVHKEDYVFGKRHAEKLNELSRFKESKDLPEKMLWRKKNNRFSVFSQLPFDLQSGKLADKQPKTGPSVTIFSSQKKLVRRASEPNLRQIF